MKLDDNLYKVLLEVLNIQNYKGRERGISCF